jgi:hypothetical protein
VLDFERRRRKFDAARSAVDTPGYHTTDDTRTRPAPRCSLASVDDFDAALGLLLPSARSAFAALDPQRWPATVTSRPRAADAELAVADGAGVPQPGATLVATLRYGGFFPAAQQSALGDDGGCAGLAFPAAAAARASHDHFLHVTAGPSWPLVQQVLALPWTARHIRIRDAAPSIP